MEKTVTKEEVERVLKLYICNSQRVDNILNELFPPDFEPKSGDWVISDHPDWKIGAVRLDDVNRLEFMSNRIAWDRRSSFGELTRHATPEEIAAAEWEEGKPYKVWIDECWKLRVSSATIGNFYLNGLFEGKSMEWDKYEKL